MGYFLPQRGLVRTEESAVWKTHWLLIPAATCYIDSPCGGRVETGLCYVLQQWYQHGSLQILLDSSSCHFWPLTMAAWGWWEFGVPQVLHSWITGIPLQMDTVTSWTKPNSQNLEGLGDVIKCQCISVCHAFHWKCQPQCFCRKLNPISITVQCVLRVTNRTTLSGSCPAGELI